MKVCLLSPLPPPIGGITTWTEKILEAFNANNEVELVNVDTSPKMRRPGEGWFLQRIFLSSIQSFFLALHLVRLFRSKFDIIHLTTSGNLAMFRDLMVLLLSKVFSIPFVYHVHHGKVPEIIRIKSWECQILRIVCNGSVAVFVLDEESRVQLQTAFGFTHILKVPNFYSQLEINNVKSRFTNTANTSRENILLFVGRVSVAKGAVDLFEAWKLTKNTEGWKLFFVGAIDPDLIINFPQAESESNICFLGEVTRDKVMELLYKSKIFCLPSYTEGFPMSLLDAMAFGKAIIASRVGAVPEMLEDDRGVLVDPGDIQGLSDALSLLISSEKLRLSFSTKAKSKAEQFYEESVVIDQISKHWKGVTMRGIDGR